jgi:hypothetical protein
VGSHADKALSRADNLERGHDWAGKRGLLKKATCEMRQIPFVGNTG